MVQPLHHKCQCRLKNCLFHRLLHPFNGLVFRTTWVSQHQKGKPFWVLMKQEMMGGSGISWTICKSFAPHSRPVTMPVPHHLVFYRADALPIAKPTMSKHWRHSWLKQQYADNVFQAIPLSWEANALCVINCCNVVQ